MVPNGIGADMRRLIRALVLVGLLLIAGGFVLVRYLPHVVPDRIARPVGIGGDIDGIRAALTAPLTAQLQHVGLSFGAAVYLRIFKEEAELELWVEDGERFALFRTYPICNFSGELGPKLKEGDRQSPEGFYQVGQGALNPNSRFHLSFNLGFPNAYDAARDRTGSFLMVHGACVSIGCYAMTDPAIEEIYVLVEAALRGGQKRFDVHAFPFRMTDARMERAAGHEWLAFWQELKPAYDAFEADRRVPGITTSDGRYHVAAR